MTLLGLSLLIGGASSQIHPNHRLTNVLRILKMMTSILTIPATYKAFQMTIDDWKHVCSAIISSGQAT